MYFFLPPHEKVAAVKSGYISKVVKVGQHHFASEMLRHVQARNMANKNDLDEEVETVRDQENEGTVTDEEGKSGDEDRSVVRKGDQGGYCGWSQVRS
jgi:hypothetical protein